MKNKKKIKPLPMIKIPTDYFWKEDNTLVSFSIPPKANMYEIAQLNNQINYLADVVNYLLEKQK